MTLNISPVMGDDGVPLTLPAVSLDVKNATLDEVVQTLNQSLGTASILRAAWPDADPGNKFTLSASNQSFWDIFKALEDQHPLDLIPMTPGQPNRGLALEQSGGGIWHAASSGPVMLYPLDVSYSKSGSGQALAGELAFPRFTFGVGIAVDPRMTVLKFNHFSIRGKDENGRAFTPVGVPADDVLANSNAWVQSFSWPAREPRSRSVTLAGEAQFLAQLSESTVTVDNPQQHAGETIAVGTRRARIGRFDTTGDRINFQITAVDPDPQSVRIQYTILDASGKIVFSGFTATTPAGTAVAGTFTSPYRIVFHAADRTKDVVVNFELRNVPLP
jgi:hypothetical protein